MPFGSVKKTAARARSVSSYREDVEQPLYLLTKDGKWRRTYRGGTTTLTDQEAIKEGLVPDADASDITFSRSGASPQTFMTLPGRAPVPVSEDYVRFLSGRLGGRGDAAAQEAAGAAATTSKEPGGPTRVVELELPQELADAALRAALEPGGTDVHVELHAPPASDTGPADARREPAEPPDPSDLVKIQLELNNFSLDVKLKEPSAILKALEEAKKKLKQKRKEFKEIVGRLVEASPSQEGYYYQQLGLFEMTLADQMTELKRLRKLYGADGSVSSDSKSGSGPTASSTSSLSDDEKKLIDEEVKAEVADQMDELEEERVQALNRVKMLEREQKRLERHGNVQALRQRVDAEKASKAGSLAGSRSGDFEDPSTRRYREIFKAHGKDTLMGWLKGEEHSKRQIEKIMADLENPGIRSRDPSRESSLNRDIAGSTFGKSQARRLRVGEEGPWPGSKVGFTKQSQIFGSRGAASVRPKQFDPATDWHRIKLLNEVSAHDMFDGNKLKFLGWLQRTKRRCDELDLPAHERIEVYRARTKGEPRDFIDHMSDHCMGTEEEALQKIEEELTRRFGSGAEIAKELRRQVDKLEKLDQSKPERLQKMAQLAMSICFAMDRFQHLDFFNTPQGQELFRAKFFNKLHDRWRSASISYEEKRNGDLPSFSYFTKFLNQMEKEFSHPDHLNDYTPEQKGYKPKDDKKKDDKKNKGQAKETKPATVLTTTKNEEETKPNPPEEKNGGQAKDRPSRRRKKRSSSPKPEEKSQESAADKTPASSAAGPKCRVHPARDDHTTEQCYSLKDLDEAGRAKLGLGPFVRR